MVVNKGTTFTRSARRIVGYLLDREDASHAEICRDLRITKTVSPSLQRLKGLGLVCNRSDGRVGAWALTDEGQRVGRAGFTPTVFPRGNYTANLPDYAAVEQVPVVQSVAVERNEPRRVPRVPPREADQVDDEFARLLRGELSPPPAGGPVMLILIEGSRLICQEIAEGPTVLQVRGAVVVNTGYLFPVEGQRFERLGLLASRVAARAPVEAIG